MKSVSALVVVCLVALVLTVEFSYHSNQALTSTFETEVNGFASEEAAILNASPNHPEEFKTADHLVQSLETATLTATRGPRVSDRFPDVELTDHEGNTHRFLSDLVRDKTLCLVFFYTRCVGTCPGTTQLMQQLRQEMAQLYPDEEINFVSISLEPDFDHPAVLRNYAQDRGLLDDSSLAPWYFCTGKYEELEEIRYALGLYDLDPIIDADKTEHAALITFGNDRYNRWVAMPAGIGLRDLRETFLRITGQSERQRFSFRMRDDVLLTSSTPLTEPPESCCQTPVSKTPECCSSEQPAAACCHDKRATTDAKTNTKKASCCDSLNNID